MISKRKDGYYVLSEKRDKKGRRKNLGGPYKTEAGARLRLKEVEYFKRKK